MSDDTTQVRWNWERQDYTIAGVALGLLALLAAVCTLHPSDDPEAVHVALNIYNGIVWIGLPAGLLTMAIRGVLDHGRMPLYERLIWGFWGVVGLPAGLVVLMGWY